MKQMPPLLEAMGVQDTPMPNLPDGWVDHATEALKRAVASGLMVCAESVRQVAEAQGLPPAPDGRAWGCVISRAKRKGWLVEAGKGYASNAGKPRIVRFWRGAA